MEQTDVILRADPCQRVTVSGFQGINGLFVLETKFHAKPVKGWMEPLCA